VLVGYNVYSGPHAVLRAAQTRSVGEMASLWSFLFTDNTGS